MRKLLNLLFLVLVFAFSISAQSDIYLSLDELISRTKKDNLSIKRGQINVDLANAEVQKSKEWWLPNVFLGTTFHHLDGRALNSDGRFFADVDRQSRWYGGELNVDLDIGKGIYNSKAKKLKAQQAVLENEASENMVVLNAISTYYDLLRVSAEKKLYEELKDNKESLIIQLEAQVNIGLRLDSELLLAKSKASRLNVKIIELNQQYRHAMANMALALNISDAANLFIDLNDLKKLDLVNANESNDSNITNHPLYKSLEFKARAEEKTAKAITQGLLIPKVGIRYSYGPFGLDFSDNQVTRGLQGYLGWDLPLGQLFYAGDSKISKAKSKLIQVELDIQKETLSHRISEYKSQLIDAEEMISLTERGKVYAEQALEKTNQRQAEGLGNLYEILLAEEEYRESQLQYYDAVINYNVLQYKLMDALGNQF